MTLCVLNDPFNTREKVVLFVRSFEGEDGFLVGIRLQTTVTKSTYFCICLFMNNRKPQNRDNNA